MSPEPLQPSPAELLSDSTGLAAGECPGGYALAAVRAMIQAGETEAARQQLNQLLSGSARQISRHRTIKIFQAGAELAPEQKLACLRLSLLLAPLTEGPAALSALLQTLCAQLPALEHSPEAMLLKGEIAWQLGDYPAAARLLAGAEAALAEPVTGGWRYAPFARGLLSLRLGLLDLLAGEDRAALARLKQAGAVQAPALRLQLAYGLRLLGDLAADPALGPLPPLLRQEALDLDALTALLPRSSGSVLERLLLLERLESLPPALRVELLSQLAPRLRQPEWIYALGLARLELGEPALATWAALAGLAPLPARLLRPLAVRLLALGQRAEARRCFETALLAHPQTAALQSELQQLLLEAYPELDQVIRLPEVPDWANGGDLALKAGLESFGDGEGALLHLPAGWEPPVLLQALSWARSLPPTAVPPLWCGELPAVWQALPVTRLRPWRMPDKSAAGESAEIQPLPTAMAAGPVFFLSSDPRSGQVWLETDPASLRRWLRAAHRQPLPARPLPTGLTAAMARPEAGIAVFLSRWQHLAPELKGLFSEVVFAETPEQIRQAAATTGSAWVFLLSPEIACAAAHLWYLKALVGELPLEIQAIALGAALPEAPQSVWPDIRLLRRSALAGCQRGSFRPLLAGPGPQAVDARVLYLPEIPLKVTALGQDHPLDQAWQAYRAGRFEAAQALCASAAADWPNSGNLQASCAGLVAACHGAQRAWQTLLEQPPAATPRGFYWRGRALAALGQKQAARQTYDQALAAQDCLQPEVLDLFPGIPRLRELCLTD